MGTKDSRFIDYWEDQRKGPKWEYYLTYGFGWTIVFFLCLFFLLKIILDERSVGSALTLVIIAPAALVLALVVTHLTYSKNEVKYKKLKDLKSP